jgi:hypothetical protein
MTKNIQWYAAADQFVSGIEEEAAASPKAFYGNPAKPADGGQRVRGAIKMLKDLTERCEAINRG